MSCVALLDEKGADGQWTKIKCDKPTQPGYKYCDEHKMRKRAIDERMEKNTDTVIDASEAFGTSKEVEIRSEGTVATGDKTAQPRNIYEKTNDVLEKALDWEEQTWQMVQGLNKVEWYKEDKTGILQPHPSIGINERAQDRTIRAVTAIAKLGIEAQSVNLSKMTRELIKSVVIKAMEKAGFNPDEIAKVRLGIAEEFERLANESTG